MSQWLVNESKSIILTQSYFNYFSRKNAWLHGSSHFVR